MAEFINFQEFSDDQLSQETQKLCTAMAQQLPQYAGVQDNDLSHRMYKHLDTELKKLSMLVAERIRRITPDLPDEEIPAEPEEAPAGAETVPAVPEETPAEEQVKDASHRDSKGYALSAGDLVLWNRNGTELMCEVTALGPDNQIAVKYEQYNGVLPGSAVEVVQLPFR